jgi:hypothetical protein
MAINHLHSSSDATSLYITVTSGTIVMPCMFLDWEKVSKTDFKKASSIFLGINLGNKFQKAL